MDNNKDNNPHPVVKNVLHLSDEYGVVQAIISELIMGSTPIFQVLSVAGIKQGTPLFNAIKSLVACAISSKMSFLMDTVSRKWLLGVTEDFFTPPELEYILDYDKQQQPYEPSQAGAKLEVSVDAEADDSGLSELTQSTLKGIEDRRNISGGLDDKVLIVEWMRRCALPDEIRTNLPDKLLEKWVSRNLYAIMILKDAYHKAVKRAESGDSSDSDRMFVECVQSAFQDTVFFAEDMMRQSEVE